MVEIASKVPTYSISPGKKGTKIIYLVFGILKIYSSMEL